MKLKYIKYLSCSFCLFMTISNCNAQIEKEINCEEQLNSFIHYTNDELNTLLSYRIVNKPDSLYIFKLGTIVGIPIDSTLLVEEMLYNNDMKIINDSLLVRTYTNRTDIKSLIILTERD